MIILFDTVFNEFIPKSIIEHSISLKFNEQVAATYVFGTDDVKLMMTSDYLMSILACRYYYYLLT